MTSGRFIARVVGLMSVVVSCAATAQTAGTSAPVVTEARRREIVQAAEALTSETLADVLRQAEAGDIEAQVLAGIALLDGKVVPKDVDKAVSWIRTAAEKNRLGWFYGTGTGMPRDAHRKSLGATQSAECERRASDWMTAHPQRRQE